MSTEVRTGLTFTLSDSNALDFELSNDTGLCFAVIQPSYVDTPRYTGETNVIPDFESITLETAHKLVTDDITVEPIQVEVVQNSSGGNTVYIGGII